jgi:hypothetical protein
MPALLSNPAKMRHLLFNNYLHYMYRTLCSRRQHLLLSNDAFLYWLLNRSNNM